MPIGLEKRKVRDTEQVNKALISSSYLISYVEREFFKKQGIRKSHFFYLACCKDLLKFNESVSFKDIALALRAGSQSLYVNSHRMGVRLKDLGYLEVHSPFKYKSFNGKRMRIAGRYILTWKADYLIRRYCEIMREEINKLYDQPDK